MVGELSNSENESEETQYSPSGKFALGSPQFPKLIKVSKTENGVFFTFEVSTDHRRGKMFTRCFLKHNQARFLSSDYLWYYRINCVIANCPFTCLIRPLFRKTENNWEILENSENHVCNHDSQTLQQEENVSSNTPKSVQEDIEIIDWRKQRKKATFYHELFEEASRRQSITSEDVYSDKNLRALALELARQPKYKEYMRNFKCSRASLTRFRKKFHIVSQTKNQWNSRSAVSD